MLHAMAAEPRGHFRQEVTGPRNRLAKLTRDDAIRLIVGQQNRTINFRAALDEDTSFLRTSRRGRAPATRPCNSSGGCSHERSFSLRTPPAPRAAVLFLSR